MPLNSLVLMVGSTCTVSDPSIEEESCLNCTKDFQVADRDGCASIMLDDVVIIGMTSLFDIWKKVSPGVRI